MIQKFKNSLVVISVLVTGLIPVLAPVAVHAADTATSPALKCGAELQFSKTAGCNDAQNGSSLDSIITNIINIFSVIVGVVAVIMIIVGGFRYITSGGESAGVTGAKNTILYAVVGLIVVALAQIIVKFVLTKATPA